MMEKLKEEDLDLHAEDDFAGFLGVNITRQDNGNILLTQPGLIKRILLALNLDPEHTNRAFTPSKMQAFGTDTNGKHFQEDYNYASVVGMLMYLCPSTRLDLAFAVHQCARYMHVPRRIHEQAL